MTASPGPVATDAAEQIEELTRRHRELEAERIRVDEQVKAAAKELEQLEQRAVEQYGTADLAELEGQLEVIRAENERLCTEYRQHLDGLEERLAAVEAEHEATARSEEG